MKTSSDLIPTSLTMTTWNNSKKKICAGCNQERHIWKNDGGKRYCKICWLSKKNQAGNAIPAPRVKPIKQFSTKREKKNEVYSVMRKLFLAKPENAVCRGKLKGCTGSSQELTIQHTKGRGIYLLDMTTWIPLCINCHRWVTDHPELAKALGLED